MVSLTLVRSQLFGCIHFFTACFTQHHETFVDDKMAKERNKNSNLTEKIRINNIELAKELTKRKQGITELSNDLQECRDNLLDTERRLNAANARNCAIKTEIQSLQQHNQKLQIELNKRDEKLAEWRLLFVSTFQEATKKYGSIIQAIGLLPAAVATADRSTNAMPSEDDESDISNNSIEDDTDYDNDDVEMEASPPHMALTPQVTVIRSEQEEFSDDSNPKLSSILDQLHQTFKNSVSMQNDDDPKGEVICEKEADTIPSITVTECNDDTSTSIKIPKRIQSDGFLQIPKLSFGKRKSEPKTPFNSKSSPKFDQKSSTPHFNRDSRSTSLQKIVEISPISKPPENHSIIAVQHDHHTSQLLSGSNHSEISKTHRSKSPNQSKTPVSSRHPTAHSTNKKSKLINSTAKDRITKRLFSNANNISNRKNNVLSNSPKSPAPIHSTLNQPNGMDSDKAPPKNIKATVASPEDCIARHRTARRAAPTDLRDPILLLKKRRKF